MKHSFYESEEKQVMDSFLENGYYIFSVSSVDLLEEIKSTIFEWSRELLLLPSSVSLSDFFDQTQNHVSVDKLNDFRVQMIQRLSLWKDLRPSMYSLGKRYFDWIVGNEVSMQRTVNLSIQLPQDDSSLLPLHSDVWSGNSPYEIVCWLPLVNCYKTKSMFVLPYKKSQQIFDNFHQYANLSTEQLYQKIKLETVELTVPFGSGVIFSHSILHGNRVNLEKATRWTFNVRLKSLLSPYGTKELGETFIPINIKPLTRIGYNYVFPVMNEKRFGGSK